MEKVPVSTPRLDDFMVIIKSIRLELEAYETDR